MTPTATATKGPCYYDDVTEVVAPVAATTAGIWGFSPENGARVQAITVCNLSGKTIQIKFNDICASTDADCLLANGASEVYRPQVMGLTRYTIRFMSIWFPADAVVGNVYIHSK
jgi:hypothetical protein